MLAANPWAGPIPATIGDLALVSTDEGLHVQDNYRNMLRLDPLFEPWMMVALTGMRKCDVFGEWHEDGFYPLAVSLDGGVLTV